MSLFPRWVCSAFGLSGTEVLSHGGAGAAALLPLQRLCRVGTLLEAYYQSVEREKDAFVLATLRGCAVLLPVTLLLALSWPQGLWWTFPITEVLSLGVFALWRRLRPDRGEPFSPQRVFRRQIRSSTGELGSLSQDVEAFCETWGGHAPAALSGGADGGGNRRGDHLQGLCLSADGYIQLTLIACEDGGFQLHVRDNAAGFDPFSLATGKVADPEAFDMDAIGMLMVKKQAKSFFYRQYQDSTLW